MKLPLKTLTAALAVMLSVCGMSTAVGAVNTEARYLRGDADGDGTVNIADVTAVQRHIVKRDLLSGANLKAAEVRGNNLDITDATQIQRYLVGFDNTYQIGEWIGDAPTEPATQANTSPTIHWFTPGENELPFIPN